MRTAKLRRDTSEGSKSLAPHVPLTSLGQCSFSLPMLVLVILPLHFLRSETWGLGVGKHGVQLGQHYNAYINHHSDVS